jgi:hypothetical protein
VIRAARIQGGRPRGRGRVGRARVSVPPTAPVVDESRKSSEEPPPAKRAKVDKGKGKAKRGHPPGNYPSLEPDPERTQVDWRNLPLLVNPFSYLVSLLYFRSLFIDINLPFLI